MGGIKLSKKQFNLSEKEEMILEKLWENSEGLTSVDMLEQLGDFFINATYVHRTINSLLEKGLIYESGSVRYNKQYARKFHAKYTKEEYIAYFLAQKGIGMHSLSSIAMALIKHDRNCDDADKIVKDLQTIIDTLQEKEDR